MITLTSLRFPKPQTSERKCSNDNGLQDSAESGTTPSTTTVQENSPIDPDLAAVIDAWPALPDAVKAGIVAMVGAAKGAGR